MQKEVLFSHKLRDHAYEYHIPFGLKENNLSQITYHNNVYKPFRKENNKPIYINKYSKHPPSILKQLPKSIEKRTSETSSNKSIFDETMKPYRDGLKESGFSEALNYIAPTTNKNQKIESGK